MLDDDEEESQLEPLQELVLLDLSAELVDVAEQSPLLQYELEVEVAELSHLPLEQSELLLVDELSHLPLEQSEVLVEYDDEVLEVELVMQSLP